MALSKIDAANFLTGTIPQGNVANASLGAGTALPAAIPTGKVLQVVTDVFSTETSTTSTSYVAVSGFAATITPSFGVSMFDLLSAKPLFSITN